MSHWLIIDVSNWAHKLLHACGPPPASTTMFQRWLELVRDKLRPERIVLAFDSPNSFRKSISPTYKANRREPPPGLQALIDGVRELAIGEGHDVLHHDGFEADDVIATVTRVALDQDRKVVICSTDKDLRQLLIDGRVVIARTVSIRNGIEFYNADNLKNDFGLHPSQWIDYQTLVGDVSDNVSGCDSFGAKKSQGLLQQVGALDAHYADQWRAKISERDRVTLANFRKRGLETSRTMVTLRTDVPLPDGWEVTT